MPTNTVAIPTSIQLMYIMAMYIRSCILLIYKIYHVAGCPTPTKIPNGAVSFSSLTPKSTALYTCNRGYDMKGKKKIKCIGSKWNSDPPTCNPSE